MIYDELRQVVGQTPVVRLNRVGAGLGVEPFGKGECLNPGGSVLDGSAEICSYQVEGIGNDFVPKVFDQADLGRPALRNTLP
jgi:cysteine synthase